MPTTRPGFIWSGTEWVAIGQEAVLAPVSYQATAPSSPATGDIWIDSDDEVPGITSSLNYRWRKIATGGETSLSGNDTSGLPLAYNPGYEQVYLNGVLQYRGSDYIATTGNTITGLTALVANDTVEVLSFVTAPIGDTYSQSVADSKFVNKNVGGLNLVIPTSVTGGTVSANGQITIGSAVSSVTVNDAFGATYDAYKIVITNGSASVSPTDLSLRLGATSTGYYTAYNRVVYSSGTTTGTNDNNAASFVRAGSGTSDSLNASIELTNPFAAKNTVFSGAYIQQTTGGLAGTANGFLNNTTSYTAFTIFPATGTGATLTGGTIRVYGYNNGA
jgi:hypothetical protein